MALKGPGLDDAEWQEAVGRAAKYICRPPEKYEYTLPLAEERRPPGHLEEAGIKPGNSKVKLPSRSQQENGGRFWR